MEPLLSASDRTLLQSLHPPPLLLPTDDGQLVHGGPDSVTSAAAAPCIAYMPHCPRALYSNIILRHWNRPAPSSSPSSSLSNLVIIGNSFAEYSMRLLPPPDSQRCCVAQITRKTTPALSFMSKRAHFPRFFPALFSRAVFPWPLCL
jgi:hypothetical protein